VTDLRDYPKRPHLAVSAAILRDARVLLVRRARAPNAGHFSLPGGAVEPGETLAEAARREVHEETGLAIAPFALAGYREVIARDAAGKVERHFVVLAFAARYVGGELQLNDEVSEARWVTPVELAPLPTTEGLSEIVAAAFERLGEDGPAP
jgi:ADP-ribose pyrophosphatase YjhB (NUDIX family)